MSRYLPFAVLTVLLLAIPNVSAGGSSATDTQCSNSFVLVVCATADVSIDVVCTIEEDLAVCTWDGQWGASFHGQTPGQGQSPAWASVTMCDPQFCLGIHYDFLATCTWQLDPCGFSQPFFDQFSYLAQPGECISTDVEIGVPAWAASPTFALHVSNAEAFALAADSDEVCRSA